MKPFSLPENFLLGTATSGFQIEGGDTNSNWYDWCQKGQISDKTSCIRADDHWNRYKEDIELIKKLNNKIYRMGIEWNRIEPKKGEFDKQAILHYRDEISLLIKNGIKPLVTLHHFSHPLWLCSEGEFENKKVVDYFARYVTYVVENLGDLVTDYITINEPNVYGTCSYFSGEFPPGKKSLKLALKVFRNMAICHIAAYKAIHKIRKEKGFEGKTMVGIAWHLRVFEPYSKNPLDKLMACILEFLFQGAIFKSMSDGRLRIPLGISSPYGKGNYQDFLGINYYTRSSTRFRGFKYDYMPDTPRNDLDWEIYPEGLSILCRKFYNKYKLPIWITENGTCDNNDSFRLEYIYDHLFEIYKLCKDGIPVERYYHWTLMDNFELTEGESARFGLIHVDFETQKRTIKRSGNFYSGICKNNGVTEEMINEYIKKSNLSLQ